MFKVAKARTFKKDVEVIWPGDMDQQSKGSFIATFRMVPDEVFSDSRSDQTTARKILESVEGVADENGNPLEPDAALEAVLADTCAVTAVVSTYISETRHKNVRAKN